MDVSVAGPHGGRAHRRSLRLREAVLGLALAPFDDFLRIADFGLARLCGYEEVRLISRRTT